MKNRALLALGIVGAGYVALSKSTFAQDKTFTVQNDTGQFVQAICLPPGPPWVVRADPDSMQSGIICAPSNRIQVRLHDDDNNPYWEDFSHDCANVKKITVEEDVEETFTIPGSVTTTGEDVTTTITHEFGFSGSCE